MTEQILKEIIKSFAYGMSPEEVSAAYGIYLDDAKQYAEEYSEDIEERKEQLERDGWL